MGIKERRFKFKFTSGLSRLLANLGRGKRATGGEPTPVQVEEARERHTVRLCSLFTEKRRESESSATVGFLAGGEGLSTHKGAGEEKEGGMTWRNDRSRQGGGVLAGRRCFAMKMRRSLVETLRSARWVFNPGMATVSKEAIGGSGSGAALDREDREASGRDGAAMQGGRVERDQPGASNDRGSSVLQTNRCKKVMREGGNRGFPKIKQQPLGKKRRQWGRVRLEAASK